MKLKTTSVILAVGLTWGLSGWTDDDLLAPAGAAAAPYPPSLVITGIEWAPLDRIVRRAKGSDNFPLTWSDDDALYTTYGDGFGFEPVRSKKSASQ